MYNPSDVNEDMGRTIDHAVLSRVSFDAVSYVPAGVSHVPYFCRWANAGLRTAPHAHENSLPGSSPNLIIPEATIALRVRGCGSDPVIIAGTAVTQAGSAAPLATRRLK
jgi:hypothetical protein